MTREVEPVRTGLELLASACTGEVFGPRDAEYSEACACWNLAWTHRPAIIVQAASEADVSAAVRHAAEHGLGVVIQSTGHGVTVPADQTSLLIVTSAMDDVRIDPEARTAVIGAGATWEPILAAAQEHGLAPLLGSTPHLGAVGYTLGGGFGWLGRAYGLAVDQVRSLRVVLADGLVVTVSPSEEPDLFWALCGAGAGSLGVITEMTVGLAPVAEVYAGNLFYPLDSAREVFDFYRNWSASVPEEMTSAFNITAFPPLELVPEPVRGQTFAIVRGCYSGGNLADGAKLIDRWREWCEPLIDAWGTMPFARSAEISNDPVDPLPASTSGRWLNSLDGEVFDAMLDAVVGGDGPSPVLFAEARHAGGAASRQNPSVSFAAREGQHLLELVGLIVTPEADVELERRFAAAWDRVAPQLAELPGFLNFTEGQERVQATRGSFGDAERERLRVVKLKYDPTDLFRNGVPLIGFPARHQDSP